MPVDLNPEVGGRRVGFVTGPRGIKPERPTLVFIHGAAATHQHWRLQIDALGEQANVLALDLPGHGATPGPASDRIDGYARWLVEVLVAWSLPKPILAGHSMGGAIAVETGLIQPDLLQGLILVGTGAHLPVNPALFEGLAQDYKGTINLVMKWAFAKNAPPELIQEGIDIMLQYQPELIINDFKACAAFDRRRDIGRINLPTLILCGEMEKMTPPSLSEFLRDNIPDARLELIPQAGHMVMLEQAGLLNGHIMDFVSGEF